MGRSPFTLLDAFLRQANYSKKGLIYHLKFIYIVILAAYRRPHAQSMHALLENKRTHRII
jgi:hypothetical protein